MSNLSNQIETLLPQAREKYHRLILVVGVARSGKTAALAGFAGKHNCSRVNLNLRLSHALLELSHRQRAARLPALLNSIVANEQSEVVVLDNIELLFAKELALDPLRLLQSISRNRTVVVAWPGQFDGSSLTYAEPDHPESRRYQDPQAIIVTAGAESADRSAEEARI